MSRSAVQKLATIRADAVALTASWGGLMPAGWTRWLLKRFEFPFEQVFPQRLDAGDLARNYDVLLFTDDAMPPKGAWGNDRPSRQPEVADTPPAMRHMLGNATADTTAPAVAKFVRDGGAVVAIGSSGRFAELLGTPLKPALARQVDGAARTLDAKDFFIPGTVLRASVDPTQPLASACRGRWTCSFPRLNPWRNRGRARV